jgi:hypothetical protein
VSKPELQVQAKFMFAFTYAESAARMGALGDVVLVEQRPFRATAATFSWQQPPTDDATRLYQALWQQ